MALLQRVRDHAESSFPSAVEQVKRSLNPLPMRKMKESVGHRLRVAPLQDMLRRQAQWLHLEKILQKKRVNCYQTNNEMPRLGQVPWVHVG